MPWSEAQDRIVGGREVERREMSEQLFAARKQSAREAQKVAQGAADHAIGMNAVALLARPHHVLESAIGTERAQVGQVSQGHGIGVEVNATLAQENREPSHIGASCRL